MRPYPRTNDPFQPNQRALYNDIARNSYSGKDAMLLSEVGEILAYVDAFTAKVNFATTNIQPLGSPIQQSFITGYSVSLTLTNIVIKSEEFFDDAFKFFHKGRHAPHYTLQSVIFGYDGSEERIFWRDCVPEGDWDLHGFSIGDVIKRNLNMKCQQPPELQKLLSCDWSD